MATQSGTTGKREPHMLVHNLCTKLTGLKDEAVSPFFRVALTTLGSHLMTSNESEFEIGEKIKRKLARQGRDRDAAIFADLHRKFQAQDLLRNRAAVLGLLLNLLDDRSSAAHSASGLSFAKGLSAHATSTPHWGRAATSGRPDTSAASSTRLHTASSASSSGISTIPGSFHSSDPSPEPQSIHPSNLRTPAVLSSGQHFNAPPTTGLRLFQSSRASSGVSTDSSHVPRSERTISTIPSVRQTSRRGERDNTSFELPESALVRDVMYVCQAIEGKYIKFDVKHDSFRIDPKVGIPRPTRTLLHKLSECGWLYSKVRKYADSRSTDRAFGLVGQSFCEALHQELREYDTLLATLESMQRQEEDIGISEPGGGLTLRKIYLWTCDPLHRLRTLAALVDICQGKKGGALSSAIHSYTQHGDPTLRTMIRHKLTLVAEPIFSTVLQWIYNGELEDTFHEFFVAFDPTVKDERLWHDKYSLRKAMVPSFLSMEQACKILLTGKSINFLRQVCADRTVIRNRDSVRSAEAVQVESIFSQDMDGVFQKMIDTVYKETSQHLLDVLEDKYKFLDHLKAMRRYLLLGQGDFIRHLMDLLEEDLVKPAQSLFLHNLTGILETAIRATNAQYDDPDILKRLDVRLLEMSPGESGWDVFSLDYHVDGPIRTVFTPDCMIKYLRVFNFLWRAKRMEYILAGVWKGQMSNARLLRSLPELKPVLHQCHVTCSEMVHFVQQVQYYINFEVLECSWDELLRKVQTAEDLDHIISAHMAFLETIHTRALLHQRSSAILAQLRIVFDLIINFQTIQEAMYHAADDELLARKQHEEEKKRRSLQGKWSVSDEEEHNETCRRKRFTHDILTPTHSKLRVLSPAYQDAVQRFLAMLASHSDLSLRFLSFRLDFNENYRSKKPKTSGKSSKIPPKKAVEASA